MHPSERDMLVDALERALSEVFEADTDNRAYNRAIVDCKDTGIWIPWPE